MQANHNTEHHTACRASEGTQSAVRILRMQGRRVVGSAAECLPMRADARLNFWPSPSARLAGAVTTTTKGVTV